MFVEDVSLVRENVGRITVQPRSEKDRNIIAVQVYVRGALQSDLVMSTRIEPIPITNVRIFQKQSVLQHVEVALNSNVVRRQQTRRAH